MLTEMIEKDKVAERAGQRKAQQIAAEEARRLELSNLVKTVSVDLEDPDISPKKGDGEKGDGKKGAGLMGRKVQEANPMANRMEANRMATAMGRRMEFQTAGRRSRSCMLASELAVLHIDMRVSLLLFTQCHARPAGWKWYMHAGSNEPVAYEQYKPCHLCDTGPAAQCTHHRHPDHLCHCAITMKLAERRVRDPTKLACGFEKWLDAEAILRS